MSRQGRQVGQPCCISQAAFSMQTARLGRGERPHLQRLSCCSHCTLKGRPDTGRFAWDALISHAGSCGLLLLGWLPHQGEALPGGVWERQAGLRVMGSNVGGGDPEKKQARGHWRLSPSAVRPPDAPGITLQTEDR